MTKLTWDNALLVSPATAKSLGGFRENLSLDGRQDLVELSNDGKKIEVAVLVTPGVAENTGILSLGYGRSFESSIAKGTGFNANVLRTSKNYHSTNVVLKKVSGEYALALAQTFHSQEEPMTGKIRPMVREANT